MTDTAAGLRWISMQMDVKQVNIRKGWWDEPVSFNTAMALLASEACEALQAWRQWGFRDVSLIHQAASEHARGVPPKPEGVGSELADILIRLLDDAERYNLDLRRYWGEGAKEYIYENEKMDFPEHVFEMLSLIVKAGNARAVNSPLSIEADLGILLMYIQTLAKDIGIDLIAEYERKLEYNKTRPYRHGRKV